MMFAGIHPLGLKMLDLVSKFLDETCHLGVFRFEIGHFDDVLLLDSC